MSALDAIWRGLCDGSTNPPDDPHLRKMVLVQARNRSMHPDETERLDALKVLRRVGGSEAMTCANAFARDVSLTVRRRLLQIGLEAGEDGWIVLRKVAGDPDPQLAVDAIQRLTDVGDKAATTRIRGMLGARHAMVRGRAAVFLGRFGGPSLIPLLRRHLGEEDPAARSAIGWAIARLDGKTEDPPPAIGVVWDGAVEQAPQAAPPRPAPKQEEAVEDAVVEEADDAVDEPPVEPAPVSAKQALADGKPDQSLPADVAPALPATRETPKDTAESSPAPAEGSVLATFRALAVYPDRRATLIASLRNADERELSEAFRGRKPGHHPDLSVGAAIAAQELGNSRWLSPIRRLASDPEPRVRVAVVGALGALCTPAVYRNLEALANDADPSVQQAALEALVQGAKTLRYESQARRTIEGLAETKDEALKAARAAALDALADA